MSGKKGDAAPKRQLAPPTSGAALLFAAAAALVLALIGGRDRYLVDPIGLSIRGEFEKTYAWPIAHDVASMIDTDAKVLMALFFLIAFTLNRAHATLRQRPIPAICVGLMFLCSAIMAYYYGSEYEIGFMYQLQYNKVDLARLDSLLQFHAAAMLIAVFLAALAAGIGAWHPPEAGGQHGSHEGAISLNE